MLFGGLGAAMPCVYVKHPRNTATRIDIRIFISISSLWYALWLIAAVTMESQRMKRVAVDGAARLSIIDGPTLYHSVVRLSMAVVVSSRRASHPVQPRVVVSTLTRAMAGTMERSYG